MKILLKIKKSVNRSFRILRVVKWKRKKARLAYQAWINNEDCAHVGQGAY